MYEQVLADQERVLEVEDPHPGDAEQPREVLRCGR